MPSHISNLRVIWLEAFLVTCITGNLSETARELGCSQPMAGRYIRHLEEWYGEPVFKEGQIGEPTEKAKEIWPIAKAIVKMLIEISPKDVDEEQSLIVNIDRTMDYKEHQSAHAHARSDIRLAQFIKKWREMNDLLEEP